MEQFLKQLSSYNILNYLVPGVLIAAAADHLAGYNLVQEDVFIGVILYYFIGLTASRIGSLIVEPFLEKVGFITRAPYADFVAASKCDPKVDILSEQNNTYRTVLSGILLLGLLVLWRVLETRVPAIEPYAPAILVITLGSLFLFAFKKQTAYVKKRVEANGGAS